MHTKEPLGTAAPSNTEGEVPRGFVATAHAHAHAHPEQSNRKTTMQIELARNPRYTAGPSTEIVPSPRASAEKRRPGSGGEGLFRSLPTPKTKKPPTLWTPLRPRRALHAALVLSAPFPHLSLFSLLSHCLCFCSQEKRPKNPTQIRRPLHRRSFWVLAAAAATREISPPASVSSPKIPAFFFSESFLSPWLVSFYCFL